MQPSKVRFDSKLEEKRPIKGIQSSTILEFIKVGVKIECQRQKAKSRLKLVKIQKL